MTDLRLPRGGRVYVTLTLGSNVTLTTAPEFAVTPPGTYPGASGWTTGSWYGAETIDTPTGEHRRTMRILLAGPDASPGAATVVSEDRSTLYARVQDNPEIIPTEKVTVKFV